MPRLNIKKKKRDIKFPRTPEVSNVKLILAMLLELNPQKNTEKA